MTRRRYCSCHQKTTKSGDKDLPAKNQVLRTQKLFASYLTPIEPSFLNKQSEIICASFLIENLSLIVELKAIPRVDIDYIENCEIQENRFKMDG